MQIVGSRCCVCSANIAFAPDGASCPNCAVAFHLACLTSTSACPKCGGDFVQLSKAQEQATASAHSQAVAWGRNAVLAICAALLATQLLFFGLALASGSASPSVIVQLIISIAFVAALYLGYGWARIWLGLSSGLGAIVAASLAWTRPNSLAVVSLLSVLAIAFAASFALLLFSPRVASFLSSQRRAT